jgi:diguanylate cyclase (GGDEF)-like protein/PAS domain S-box-containing protein
MRTKISLTGKRLLTFCKLALSGMVVTIPLLLNPWPASTPPPVTSPTQLDHVTLQLQWKHQFQFAGYYAALEQGFYRQAGLDVQLLEGADNIQPAQEVLQGKADFGVAASNLVLLRGQGYPVVALASIYQHSPFIFLAGENSGIDTVHDLVGKKVMLEPQAAELLAYLESESVLVDQITWLPHSYDTSLLADGQVDAMSAYSTDEPFLLQQAGVDYRIFNPRAGGIDFYGDTLFTSEAQVRQHPQRVAAFRSATLLGWQYALAHPQEMVDLIYTHYSQRHSREHLLFEAEQTNRLILPDVVEIGYMNPGRWQRIAEIYTELGMLQPGVSLQGFLYQSDPSPDQSGLYLLLAGALAAIGAISFVALRFYQLNVAIRREVEDRARTEAHLRLLEERYRILVENAPFPIVITRLEDGKMMYVNPSMTQKFELTQEQALGKAASELYVFPSERTRMMQILTQQGAVQEFEVQFITTSGKKFWGHLSAKQIVFEEEPAAFFSILDIDEWKRLQNRLESLAMTDDLTGLFNRRFFRQRGKEEFKRARRYQLPLALLAIDVDKFKDVNDTYGHDIGDSVLKEVAALLGRSLRDIDLVGRIGGEEFGVILPDSSLPNAMQTAERLRAAIEQLSVHVNGYSIRVTVSIGAAAYHAGQNTLDDLLKLADRALYQAKEAGRNRVVSLTTGKT